MVSSKSRISRIPLSFFLASALASQLFLLACASPAHVQAEENKAQSAKLEDQSTPQSPAAAGNIRYTVQRGDSALLLARKYLSQSSFMTVADFESAIRGSNGAKTGSLKPGAEITIPGIEKQPLVERPRPLPKDADLRAIYLTGTMAESVKGLQMIRRWHDLGGNAVVFDIKDSDGALSIAFDHPLALKRRPSISNLPKFARFLHSLNIHSIARIALFRDENIAQRHSELAVQSRSTGKPWLENGKQVWADPSNSHVQEYDLALAKHVAASGVDEIQFDYVRFPAEGNQKDAQFAFEKQSASAPLKTIESPKNEPATALSQVKTRVTPPVGIQRKDVIANFLAKAYSELHPMGVLISVDVFGVMAWQRPVDLAHTGQDIVLLARHCDVLSPMIYPSHFFGMDGYALPGDAPEHFIGTSMQRFQQITADSGVTLRPWLQAFAWRTRTYSADYIRKQVLTSKQHGGIGFLLWNARNDYSKPFAAMPSMVADAGQYFGRNEDLGKSTVPASMPPQNKSIPLKVSPSPSSSEHRGQ